MCGHSYLNQVRRRLRGVDRWVAGEPAGNKPIAALAGADPCGVREVLLGQNQLVTVSHAQAIKTAAVLDENFPRLAEQLFGAQ